jgi:CheY-like chemotaxis protein
VQHLLLIEDNPIARRNIRRLLSRYGFQVTEAPDGMTGLDAARRDPSIDLLLCDVDLPDIDGHTVVRLLRNEPGTNELPIIAVTAHVYIGSREESLAAGCNDWEPKPINFQRLRQKIDLLLGQPATVGP